MFRLKQCCSLLFGRKISTGSKQQSPFRRGIHTAFGKYLLLTNTATSGILMIVGDVVQQEIEYRQKLIAERYDYGRITRMFLVGLSQGPLHHYFYIYLHKFLPKRNISSITQKILLDQFVMSPVCIAAFFYSIGLLEIKSLSECTLELKDKCLEVYMMDWCVWPPTQFINFYLVPIKYQVLYVNGVTMLYNVFISYIKHRDSHTISQGTTSTIDMLENPR